jgi:hypothetical protein
MIKLDSSLLPNCKIVNKTKRRNEFIYHYINLCFFTVDLFRGVSLNINERYDLEVNAEPSIINEVRKDLIIVYYNLDGDNHSIQLINRKIK